MGKRMVRRRLGLGRRQFLRQALGSGSALVALPWLSACGSSDPSRLDRTPPPAAGTVAFLHGVASGDPYPDSVVLWTRVTPGAEGPLAVGWRLYADPERRALVASGEVVTDAARDYTVKVVPGGLEPARSYYYEFAVAEIRSPLGRTRTAPAADATVSRLRFATTSCAWLTQGYFNSYGAIARRADLDAVFTLGDYLYEYGPEDVGGTLVPGRTFDPPREMVTLADYRLRHANYKRDLDLQEAHRQHPWLCIWDDHESTNDSHATGAQNHTEGEEGIWTERKASSIQAFFEWMPVREEVNPLQNPGQHLYRRLRYGDLVEIFLLDTRLEGRDPQPADATEAAAAGRRMISASQEQFLLDGLLETTARWKLIGQQTMIARLFTTPGTAFTLDAWDGYLDQRNRLLDFIGGTNPRGTPIENVVVLTGDIHTAFAMELTRDPTDTAAYTPGEQGSVGVEMVCPSITSVGFPEVQALKQTNRHMRYAEASGDAGHGYTLLDITAERCQGEWYFSTTVLTPSSTERAGLMGVWKADDGVPFLSPGTASTAPPAPPLAP
ncbi:MAG TPA: alkaline phosphatase D family protein [Nevskiaceae bacterium]|nr:alkaline phosphatase D family protein [Nevskiaceae bacterium]